MSVATRLLAMILVGSALIACSATAATSSPAASASPTVVATSGPTTLAPSLSTAAGATSDPAAGLRIGAPYALSALSPETAASVQSLLSGQPGPAWSIGGREVVQNGTLAGYVLVFGLASSATDTDFQNGITGMGAAMGVTPQQTSMAGTPVWTASNDTVSVVAYRAGNTLVDVETQGRSPDVAAAIAAALIAANR